MCVAQFVDITYRERWQFTIMGFEEKVRFAGPICSYILFIITLYFSNNKTITINALLCEDRPLESAIIFKGHPSAQKQYFNE